MLHTNFNIFTIGSVMNKRVIIGSTHPDVPKVKNVYSGHIKSEMGFIDSSVVLRLDVSYNSFTSVIIKSTTKTT